MKANFNNDKPLQLHHNQLAIWGINSVALVALYENLLIPLKKYKIGFYDINDEYESKTEVHSFHYKNYDLKVNALFNEFQKSHFFALADIVLFHAAHCLVDEMWLILDETEQFKPNIKNLKNTTKVFFNEQNKSIALQLKNENSHIQLIYSKQVETIAQHIEDKIISNIAPLIGLVLTGGDSKRMNENKSLIKYHQQPQWLHVFEMLEDACTQTFISCTQHNQYLYLQKQLLIDKIIGYGPLSGIITALLEFKNKAILVAACDLPLIDKNIITQLIVERDASKMATTFYNEESNQIEPLITIYEPRALTIMLQMLASGFRSPQAMLTQNDIKIVKPNNPSALKNINFPEEKEQIMQFLKAQP